MRRLAFLLVACSAAAQAREPEPCPSAEPEPLLHPAPGQVREHRFMRLPRRMAAETLRMRDGFVPTLLREGCETFAVTFDLGPMPATHANAATLRAAGRVYMQRILHIDPDFWIARRFLHLESAGEMHGRRLHLVDGDASYDIGSDDSEPDRLLVVFADPL